MAGWDAKAIAQLEALWVQFDISVAEIARRLGASKGGVAGKAHRMGLVRRPKPAAIARAEALGTLGTKPRPECRNRQTETLPPLPSIEEPKPVERIRPDPRRTSGTCCWPIGDKRPYRFCEAPAPLGRSYCDEHDVLGHVSSRPPIIRIPSYVR